MNDSDFILFLFALPIIVFLCLCVWVISIIIAVVTWIIENWVWIVSAIGAVAAIAAIVHIIPSKNERRARRERQRRDKEQRKHVGKQREAATRGRTRPHLTSRMLVPSADAHAAPHAHTVVGTIGQAPTSSTRKRQFQDRSAV